MNTTRYGLRPLTAVLLPLAAAALVACGGGGGGSSSGTGTGTGGGAASSFARGTITGFGSIFVNGVEYDTSHATIKDDDGNVQNESALHLGMTVEVSGTDATGANGMSGATTVIFNSSIVGPVGSIDTAASTLTLFGQTVDVTR